MRHNLLVALDGGKTSGATATYVGRACAAGGESAVQVVLFHVLPPLPPYIESSTPTDVESTRDQFEAATEQAATRMLENMKERLVREQVNGDSVSLEIVEDQGDVARQIIDAAKQHDCDTIVIGRRGKSMISQFFGGGIAERLLRNPIGLAVWVVE